MTIFKVFKQEKVKKAIHYVMLFAMLHSSLVAPCQNMFLGFLNLKKPLRYTGQYQTVSNQIETGEIPLEFPSNQLRNNFGKINSLQKQFSKTSENYLAKLSLNADILKGNIGTTKEIPSDNARDNLFKFDFQQNQINFRNAKAYLVYEIKGVESANRSINDRFATGGYMVKYQKDWTQKKELIDFNWLQNGENRVMFSVPKNANYGYEIKNVRIEIEELQNGVSSPMLIVDNEEVKYVKEGKVYIKGFLPQGNSEARIYANDQPMEIHEGEFEGFVTINKEIKKRGFIILSAYDSKGLLGQELFTTDQLIEADEQFAIEHKTFEKSEKFNKASNASLSLEGASIHIKEGALDSEKRISIKKLRTVDVAPLSPGMVNVTKGAKGYRFLPDGTQFASPVDLSLEYDEQLIPKGYSAKDIKTFYFDTRAKSWVVVKRDTILEEKKIIQSSTNHFTDYINGIIQTPESPETAAFTSTMMNDIKVADPSSEMTIISPPEVSQVGDANVSYPIKIPSGRKGMQPNLAIQYNSDANSGWLGEGWNLSLPAITLDTRWGAAQIDPMNESEIYTLGGEQLMYPQKDGKDWMPNRHFDVGTNGVYSTEPRPRIANAIFTPRKQGSFAKIERLGDNPEVYYWKITGTDGSISWYGGDSTGFVEEAVIKNDEGYVVHWALRMVEDVHKNNIIYQYKSTFYQGLSGDHVNLNYGKSFYPDTIYYTGSNGSQGDYKVQFFNDQNIVRKDVKINSRLGYKEIVPHLLNRIEVSFQGNVIRSYNMIYEEGVFYKTLLKSIEELDSSGHLFYDHKFDYYNDIPKGIKNDVLFDAPYEVQIPSLNTNFTFGAGNLINASRINAQESIEMEWGVTPMAGLEVWRVSSKENRNLTFGFPFGESSKYDKGKITLNDIDGNGLEDIIYKTNAGLRFLPHFINDSNQHYFGQPKDILNVNQFQVSKGWSKTMFGESFEFNRGKFSAGRKRIKSSDKTITYFTDGNGDGLPDIVVDNKVYFNHVNSSGNVVYETSSAATPNMVITAKPAEITPETVEDENPEAVPATTYDVVRVWQAPRSGIITIEDTFTFQSNENSTVTYSIETDGNLKIVNETPYRLFLKEFNQPVTAETILLEQPFATIPPLGVSGYDLNILAGQRIYFRLHKNKSGKNDVLITNPKIKYTWGENNLNTPANLADENNLLVSKSNYEEGLLLSDDKPVRIEKNGNVSISWGNITASNLTDDVTFTIIKIVGNQEGGYTEEVVYQRFCPQGTTTLVSPSTNDLMQDIGNLSVTEINANTEVEFKFVVKADSNVRWRDIEWKPELSFTAQGVSTPEKNYPVPDYDIYEVLDHRLNLNLRTITCTLPYYKNSNSDDHTTYSQDTFPTTGVQTFSVFPNTHIINTGNSDCLSASDNGEFLFVVKKDGLAVGKIKVLIVNGQIKLNATQSMPIPVFSGNLSDPNLILPKIFVQYVINGDANFKIFKKFTNSVANDLEPYTSTCEGNVILATGNCTVSPQGVVTPPILRNITDYKRFYGGVLVKRGMFGPMYRNWGQFLYNSALDNDALTPEDSYGKLINTKLIETLYDSVTNSIMGGLGSNLNNCETADAQNAENCFEDGMDSTLGMSSDPDVNEDNVDTTVDTLFSNPNLTSLQTTQTAVVRMNSERKRNSTNTNFDEKWTGFHDAQYSSGTAMKNGDIFDVILQSTNTTSDIETQILQADLNTGMNSLTKEHRNVSKSYSLSKSFSQNMGGSFAYSKSNSSYSTTVTDFVDLNGDRYPDLISTKKAQLTNMTGGHNEAKSHSNEVNESNSFNKGISGSKQYLISGRKEPNAEEQQDDEGNVAARFNLGVNANLAGSNKEHIYWLDLNGDGLPDKVKKKDNIYKFSLNKGGIFTMADIDVFNNLGTTESKPAPLSANVSFPMGGFETDSFSFSLNSGMSASSGTSVSAFHDVNGDGLVDMVLTNGNDTSVRYNLGNRFSQDVVGLDAVFNATNNRNTSGSLSGRFGVFYGFPICCPLLPRFINLKFGAVFSGNINLTVSDVQKSLRDFNGDGFVDYVVRDGDNFKVYPSNIRRTNKLKTVTNPLGGSFTIDYKPQKTDYKNPNAKWAMTSVVTNDGYNKENDGVDSYRTEFAYENGNYDRREREFYGYEKIYVKDVKVEANGVATVYRTSISKFHNTNYFLRGMLKENYTIKGSDETQLYSKTENFYEIKQLANGNQDIVVGSNLPETFDVGGTEGRRSAAVLMVKSKTYFYELNPTPQLTTEVVMVNDQKGRVIEYINKGDVNDANDDYNSKIEYHDITSLNDKNIISIPSSISVFVNGSQKRRRSTTVDSSNGNVLQIRATTSIRAGTSTVTDLVYDNYGNLTRILLPKNSNPRPQRMTYYYSYDTTLNKYVTGISDSFGYSSTAVYDPKLDKILETTDRNGNKMLYTYDSFGRNTIIKAPKEIEAGRPYTIKFEYFPKIDDFTIAGIAANPTTFVPVAVTKHYDVSKPTNDIETFSFIDGLGRSIQVKKDIAISTTSPNKSVEVNEHLSVSGMAKYDDYGRVVFQYHPNSETKTNTAKYVLNQTIAVHKSESQYDELDRLIKSIDPDGNIATNEFSIANVTTNQQAIKTRSVVAQNGSANVVNETYKDASGKVIATKNEGPNGDIWTKFSYNPIGELLSYTDSEQITTTYEYDLLGRKTKLVHPDNGTTTYYYDDAGNLTQLQTANLYADNTIADPNNRFVKYKYNFNRLEQITYPATASGANISNVNYLYGAAADPDPLKRGRLLKITDATGTQEFEYGNMGEVVKNSRKVVGPNLPTRYFTTNYNYDSWNRLMSVTYPDQENVLYHYDFGGNLTQMTGIVNGSNYNYIERIEYDHYEQRKFIKYGNGTETAYAYAPSMRRLENLTVTSGSGNSLFQNNYKYDKVGNVTSVENTAGPAANGYGGNYTHNYTYDKLNRLINATGSFVGDTAQKQYNNDFASDYNLEMEYNNTHGIMTKNQEHIKNESTFEDNTYKNKYTYYAGTHKVQQIENVHNAIIDTYTYDLNGNTKGKTDGLSDTQFLWDESNRLRVVSNGTTMQHNIYDAAGERVLKASSNLTTVYQNGTPVNSGAVTFAGYTTYPSGLIVIDPQGVVTKHYYAGTQRIVSHVSANDASQFENNPCGSCKEAEKTGPSDEEIQKVQMQDLQERLEKAKLGKAVFEKAVPVQYENQNTEPGAPSAKISAAIAEALYFFHPDHLGTATYMTDAYGEAYEFFLNLPFGETMVQQRGVDAFENRYKFTGKELDEETGLYYFGARYYDPKASIWMSVDPLAEKFPGWNPYNYTMQNPINLIDPDGMASEKPNVSGVKNVKNVLQLKKWIDYRTKAIKDTKWMIGSYGVLYPYKATYYRRGECADYSRLQVEQGSGDYTAVGAKNRVDMYLDSRTEDKSRYDFQKGIDTIIENLNEGKSVMAGVMYDSNKTTQKKDYANKSTNHYVTIVGMGKDENGNTYFSYYDNYSGDKGQSVGTDLQKNRFTLHVDSKGNYYFADADNNIPLNGNETRTLNNKQNRPARYILTEIRDNE